MLCLAALIYSDDGTQVAFGSLDCAVWIGSVSAGVELREVPISRPASESSDKIRGTFDAICEISVTFSPDGHQIFCGPDDNSSDQERLNRTFSMNQARPQARPGPNSSLARPVAQSRVWD